MFSALSACSAISASRLCCLLAEQEDEVRAAALLSLELWLLGLRALLHGGLQPHPVGERIFDEQVRRCLTTNGLLHLEVKVGSDLLSDGERRATAAFSCDVELERLEVQRLRDRLGQRSRDGACRQILRP